MATELKLATICLNATADFEQNVSRGEALVKKAASLGADWVMLPEMFTYYGPYEKLWDYSEPEGGPIYQRFSKLAKDLGIVLFSGTMNERPTKDELAKSTPISEKGYKRVFNTLYIFDRKGKLVEKYRKTHLFNLYDENGKELFFEEGGFIPGNELKMVEIDSFRVGLAICFEIRFPSIFTKLYMMGPPDILAIPSAFTLATGTYHWELLLRARAVENLCYVFSANQTGSHSKAPGARASSGHSMIIDPWGNKLSDTGDTESVAMTVISKERIAACRAKLPIEKNLRPELY